MQRDLIKEFPCQGHSDVQPLAQVCDFGLSKVRHATLMSSHTQVGTPSWTAPEVLRSEGYNTSSDVFSMGVILWELVMRQEPWGDMHPNQVCCAEPGDSILLG